MPVIGVRAATMAHDRFGSDFGPNLWAAAPAAPTAEQRAQAERDRVALELLPAIFEEDFAAGLAPLGGFAKMKARTVDFTTSSLIPSDDGCYWVPASHVESLSGMLDIVDPVPNTGPGETLSLHVHRAIAAGRVPQGFCHARHPTDLNAGISGVAFGPTIQIAPGEWMIPERMAESARGFGFVMNPRKLR